MAHYEPRRIVYAFALESGFTGSAVGRYYYRRCIRQAIRTLRQFLRLYPLQHLRIHFELPEDAARRMHYGIVSTSEPHERILGQWLREYRLGSRYLAELERAWWSPDGDGGRRMIRNLFALVPRRLVYG